MRWGRIVLQAGIAVVFVLGLIYGAKVTADLVEAERKLTANAVREPQLGDPLRTFVEVTLPEAPMPLLSAGYLGIAPSIHLVRLNTSLPLANVDEIENLARRRYGRVDVTFILVNALPLLILPIALLRVLEIREKGAWEAVQTGRKKKLDFAMEYVALPLFAWGGFTVAALLSLLFPFGLKLDNNENLLRLALWLMVVGLYAVFWLLVFVACLLRFRTLNSTAAIYAVWCMLLLVAGPCLAATIHGVLSGMEPRTETALLRRESLQRYSTVQEGERIRSEWDFRKGKRYLTSSIIAPGLILQNIADKLARTDSGSYSDFRDNVVEFSVKWKQYLLPFARRGESLGFDDLKATPKFAYQNRELLSLGEWGEVLILLSFILYASWQIRRTLKERGTA